MIRPERMARVLIIGPRTKQEAVIERLQEMNLLHVRDFKEEDHILRTGGNSEGVSKDAELLYKLRLARSKADLRPAPGRTQKLHERDLEREVGSDVGQINQTVHHVLRLSEEIVKARNKVQLIDERISFLRQCIELGLRLEDLGRYESVSMVMGTLERRADRGILHLFPGVLIRRAKRARSDLVAFFLPSEQLKVFREHLGGTRFAEVKVPHLPHTAGRTTPEGLVQAYTEEKKGLEDGIGRAEARIKKEMGDDRERMLAAEEYLAMKVQRGEFPPRIAVGKVSFAIEGWVPRRRMKDLDRMGRDLGDDVGVVEAKDDGDAPTLMRHVRPADSFEIFTKMYSPPKKDEIDPTALLAVAFPLFFGFIVGDMGYGLLIAGFALFLRKYRFIGLGGKELSNILLLSAASSVLWGAVFGEIFGLPLGPEEGVDYSVQGILGMTLPYHGLISKIADVKVLMLGSIVAGFIHLFLGLAIGAYNESHHSMRRAVLGKGGWMLLLTGFFVVTFLLLSGIKLPFNAAYIVLPCLGLGLVSLVAGEGVLTSLEVLSILTNTLSYVRLFAVGLAKAGLAIAVDSITVKMMYGEIWYVGIVAFFVAHFGLMFLAILSAGLHSIRLNYVEFFSKFYEGGGHMYTPFGFIRRMTERGEKNGN